MDYFLYLFVVLWAIPALSIAWIILSSILLMQEFKCRSDRYSRKTLWNPMNALLIPSLLTERGLRIRKSIGRACIVFLAGLALLALFLLCLKILASFGHGGGALGNPKGLATGKNWGLSVATGHLAGKCTTGADVDRFIDGEAKGVSLYRGIGGSAVANDSGTAFGTGFGFGGGSIDYFHSHSVGDLGGGW